jgi:hypothetical protein
MLPLRAFSARLPATFLRALACALFAVVLGACGVKGPLVPAKKPAEAAPPPPPPPATSAPEIPSATPPTSRTPVP